TILTLPYLPLMLPSFSPFPSPLCMPPLIPFALRMSPPFPRPLRMFPPFPPPLHMSAPFLLLLHMSPPFLPPLHMSPPFPLPLHMSPLFPPPPVHLSSHCSQCSHQARWKKVPYMHYEGPPILPSGEQTKHFNNPYDRGFVKNWKCFLSEDDRYDEQQQAR
ncbi:unnamed protein product, partial [Closterium sp. NIES-54]